MKRILLLLAISAQCAVTSAQSLLSEQPAAHMREHLLMLNNAKYIDTKPGAAKTTYGAGKVFDTAKWAFRIDSTWGTGLTSAQKLDIFNTYWGQMDSFYACFVGRPLYNWDSIVNAMRTEISGGVSKGRFAGILGKLMAYINDGHSNVYDRNVSYGSAVYPGLPVFRGESGKFGACITTIDDTIATVYSADAGQPFGLQQGDVILGYNHIPWTRLVDKILEYQLPVAMYRAATEAATYHRYMQAVGENWYLFDTINIRKCDGSLVNFPTSLMIGKSFQDLCLEELPVAGIHTRTYADYYTSNRTTCSGVIKGTRTGYVSFIDCMDFSGDSLYNAVKILVEDSLINGLIIDIRTNYGGSILSFYKTFKYLNNGDASWLGEGERVTPLNRYTMFNYPSSSYDATDDDPNHFDNKIAILCGPGAGSSGDLFSVLFTRHPMVKTFGKSTEGAFGAFNQVALPDPNFGGSRQSGNFYDAANPSYYLTHTEYPIDSPIWYTKSAICSGTDNMLNAAVGWINPKLEVNSEQPIKPSVQIYPNPSADVVNIVISSPVNETVTVRLCNVLGATLKIANANITTGDQIVKMDLTNMQLPDGTYYILLQSNSISPTSRKIILIH